VSLCPPQILHELTSVWIQADCLSVWAMAWHLSVDHCVWNHITTANALIFITVNILFLHEYCELYFNKLSPCISLLKPFSNMTCYLKFKNKITHLFFICEILLLKFRVFWVVAPCSLGVDWRFRGVCHLHQDAPLKRRSTPSLHRATSQKTLKLHICCRENQKFLLLSLQFM
jgi:hypothetical protein